MDFVALDVELANTNLCSICQIGMVRYENGSLVEEYSTLVDPQDKFFGMGIRIHSIREEDVLGKPRFAEIIEPLHRFLNGRTWISHGGLDKSAIKNACSLWELPEPEYRHINSQSVVRRTWTQFRDKGFGLEDIAAYLDIQYQAHDALEDAKAAARVMLAAIDKTGLGIEEWYEELNKKPKDGRWTAHEVGEGNPNGIFYGKEIVFTGFDKEVDSIFSKAARELGFNVANKLTKGKTTHCCHSDAVPEATLKAGKDITSKHAAALKWNKEIWTETKFRQRFLGGS